MEVDLDDKDFWNKILPEMKNAQGLTRKLGDKESFRTEEQIESYLNDVQKLVDERIAEMKKFKHTVDDNDPLGKLFIILTFHRYVIMLLILNRYITILLTLNR